MDPTGATQVPPPPKPPGVGRALIALMLGAGVLLVAVVVIAVVVGVRSGSSGVAEEGDVVVIIGLADTSDCDYAARFFGGGDVVLLDSSGEEIDRAIVSGSGELSDGAGDLEPIPGCYWTIEFRDLPESTSYSIDYDMPGGVIGGREYAIEGRVTMTVDELEAAGWLVDIRLGT